MKNIYDFFENPENSVQNGYKPNYLTCVSRHANDLSTINGVKSLWNLIKEIPDTEVRDFPRSMLTLLLCTLNVIVSPIVIPILIWFLGYSDYKKFK